MKIRSAVMQLSRKHYEEESEPLKGDILDCALGYNSVGTPERVVDFAKRYSWSQLRNVPDTSYKDLKREICRFWSDFADLGLKNVKVANGSAVFLSRFNKLFIEPGVKVLGYMPQFKEYSNEVRVLGGSYEAVPLDAQENFKFNLDKFLGKIGEDHSIIYIDNPNNPTGQLISLSAIETIAREAAKKQIVVILDEAYGDYVEEKYSAINLIDEYKNLVVTRTFTKGYGVGQFRVGYAILSIELSEFYDRVELPFSVSTMGALLAREALLDQDFILNLREHIKAEKEKLARELNRRGYLISETCPSCPLFILSYKNRHLDLRLNLLNKGILTASGADWQNLDRTYVRINTPARADCFLSRL